MSFNFSARCRDENHEPNPLTEAIAARKKTGLPLLDLTLSNPTHCRIDLPSDWTSLLAQSEVLNYEPHPQGDLKAREAISRYYSSRGETLKAEDFFLTAGTSEGYSHLFKLLCNPGDEVLVPAPSYPLLETLASLEGIQLLPYRDLYSLGETLTEKTRAIFVIQPNNPTGNILSRDDAEYLVAFAEENNLAVVVDEVFADYLHEHDLHENNSEPLPVLRSNHTLVFTLNGLSKLVGLPQLKLAWIHVGGNESLVHKAKEHLEWICDAYLSVNTASQIVCPELMRRRDEFQKPIQQRLQSNLETLREIVKTGDRIEPLWPKGGWCVPIRCKSAEDDEALALSLIRNSGVLTHPGYFFDFEEENILVLSLLTPPEIFREGLKILSEQIHL